MALFLALISAIVYGAADFLGGLASRRAATLAVVACSQMFGFLLLLLALPLFPQPQPAFSDLAWGGMAGVAGSFGIILLYHGLAKGPMSVVAPLTAVCAATLPVVVGVTMGESPSRGALTGVGLALVAIALISRDAAPSQHADDRLATGHSRGVILGLVAGLAFGAFYICLAQAAPASGLWPLLGARSISLLIYIVLAFFLRQSLTLPRSALTATVAAGILDMMANILYVLAVRRGLMSLVAVLASLYPASTVVLARVVLAEKLRSVQLIGLLIAVLAVVLITSCGR